jgi:phage-related protein
MNGKPLRWIHGEVKTPPMSRDARREIGFLLRELQDGIRLAMPQSRPMPVIGARCHELRVNDVGKTWRLVYRLDIDAIVILEVFEKKTNQTPLAVITACRQRLKRYEEAQA